MDPRNHPIGELNCFLYSQCYDRLCAAASDAIGRPVSAVIHYNQISVQVDEDRIYYVFEALAEYEPDEMEVFQFTARISLDGCTCTLDVTKAVRKDCSGREKPPRYGVFTDQHLIPRLYMDERREEEAERFLRRYCPEALAVPMPVPIRSIMEEQMGLNVEADIRLPDGAYGQIMYSGGEMPVMRDAGEEPVMLSYKRGDVLIDGDQVLLRGPGSMNCTLAHEAYHWFAHRTYVDFHNLTGKQVDGAYNGMSRYSADDILEIQANAMAFRILMPREAFIRKDSELAEMDIHDRISGLASFFRVSYPAATIRLSQLGRYDFRMPTETVRVTPSDACDLYFSDVAFRELVDTERIVYTDQRYVCNRPEFVERVWEDVPKYGCPGRPYRLTEYAISHPDEAFVRFRIDHRRVIGHNADTLQARSDAYLKAQVAATRLNLPEVAGKMKQHAKKFERIYQKAAGKETFCELAGEMIDYRYGPMNRSDAAAGERVRDSESSPVALFCADTLQPRQYYEKIMKGTAGQPDNRTLMSLCVGLCLSPDAATRLFRAAGRALSGSLEDMAYRYILLHLREEYIEDVNVFLDELALSPLGAKKNVAL